MRLVNPIGFVRAATKLGVAVPAMNIHTLESLQAIVLAANELRSPMIIQVSPGALAHFGLKTAVAIARAQARDSDVPLALHMDHCQSFEVLCQCLREGFTSLMVDSSKMDYAANVLVTRRVADMARCVDVCVEGELGRIGGVEDDLTLDAREASMTVPDEAARYVSQTGIDMLAVAIGTAHGVYRGEPELDMPRLSAIREAVEDNVPLVLHGASGVTPSQLTDAISRGIAKVNIATDLRIPLTEGIERSITDNPGECDPRRYMGEGRQLVKLMAMDKIRGFGAVGLADRLRL